MYIYISGSGFVILGVVCDDVVLSSDSRSLLEGFEAEMKKLFQVKVLSEVMSFIGLQINRDGRGKMARQTK